MENSEYFVSLSSDPVKFDPISKVTNVFFDEMNKQVFTVRSGGVTGVQVQGPKDDLCHSFRMSDKGAVSSIKLSPSQNVLALQRTKSAFVEFINLNGKELDEVEYCQGSRNKNAVVLGFVWTQPEEVLLITDQGLELFQVLSEKRALKPLRSLSSHMNWFVSCPLTRLVVLAGGPVSAQMQPVACHQPGTLTKLPKFQIDIPVTSTKGNLVERDVTLARLYGNSSVLVLRHPPRPPGSPPLGAQVLIYTVHKTLQTTRHTHTLCLESIGRFALSVVDNLVLVHHQASRSTLLFDPGAESGGEAVTLRTLLPPRGMRPCRATLQPTGEEVQCQLYSDNWVVFQPNIVIDAKLGLLWYVELDLAALVALRPPPVQLVDLLLRRRPDSTLDLLLQVLQEITDPCRTPKTDLQVIAQVFDLLNHPYRRQLNVLAQPHIATPAHSSHAAGHAQQGGAGRGYVDMIVVDQSLMYSRVFSRYPELKMSPEYDGEFGIKVMLEYIRSLSDAQILVQDVNELFITCLLQERNGLSRLLHLLQYRVLSDSKPLACSLLSLEKVYPPALQLSLDMLKRLGNADDEIIEILLHKQMILPTLRFARSAGLIDTISARKFLEAAQLQGDPALFYSVYKLFESRNRRLRGDAGFAKGELFDSFVRHFETLFVRQEGVS